MHASLRRVAAAFPLAALMATGEGRPGIAGAPPPASLVVFAASSLTAAMTDVARQYEQPGQSRLVLNFGASGALARQILDGARVDLFLSADEATMRSLEAAGKVEPGTKVSLLSNQLVIIVPAGRRRPIKSGEDLKAAAFRRVAIGDPSVVSAGVYARRYLELLGVWQDLESRLLPTATVRDAVKAVEAGQADAAIVFRTDARDRRKVFVALAIPRDRTPGIVYQAAVVSASRNLKAARQFLDYLRDVDARAIFVREGFVALVGGYLRHPSVP